MLQGLGCDPHLLDGKLTGTNFGLRLNYYPPMTAEQDRSGAGRLLGHEDVDLFTILPASRMDGLQVWNHRSGKWVRMSAPRGFDHHQHRRLHAAHVQRPAAVDNPPRRQAERRLASRAARGCRSRSRSICGRTKCWRCCPGSARRNTADQGDHLPHAQHEQILRRRLRGREPPDQAGRHSLESTALGWPLSPGRRWQIGVPSSSDRRRSPDRSRRCSAPR